MDDTLLKPIERKPTFFETKIKPALLYVGTIGAGLTSIAYIALVCILIFGFLGHNMLQTIVFAVINAVIGFTIMQMLKIQGQDFAKTLPENVPILAAYHQAQTKDKKFRSMRYYWTKTLISDAFTKALTIAFTTIGIIYIVIQGSQDYTLLLMAFVNLVMFFCFGLISLSKTYDFFNNEHMAYVQEQLRIYYKQQEAANEPKETKIENEKTVEMVAGEPNKQGDAGSDDNRGSSILEPPGDISVNGNPNKSILLGRVRDHLDSLGGNNASNPSPITLHFHNS